MRARGLTLAQTARKLQVTPRSLYRYLAGQPCRASVVRDMEQLFQAPAQALGITRQVLPQPDTLPAAQEAAKRAAHIRQCAAAGQTQAAIGRELGISRQRVHQLLHRS